MRQRRFNLAAAVSLVLCAASIALWLRSTNHLDLLSFALWAESGGLIGSEFGTLVLGASAEKGEIPNGFSTGRSNNRSWLQPGLIQWLYLSGDNEPDVSFSFAGFALTLAHQPARNGSVNVPDWFLIALFGVASVWLRKRARRLSALSAAKVCSNCGYDLRATPDRCPECGTAASEAVSH